MKDPVFPTSFWRKRRGSGGSRQFCPLIARIAIWFALAAWRTSVGWRAKRPFLMRVTAHMSIVGLALITIFLSGVGIPAPRTAAGSLLDDEIAFSIETPSLVEPADPAPTPSLLAAEWPPTSDTNAIIRLPVPHTAFPERPRAEVVTYVVQEGDTIFDIAVQFNLMPETVVWSNGEALQNVPWLIKPGLQLFILPVDGVYHTVRSEETIESIALKYELDPAATHNEWNDLEEGDQVAEGQLLVLPSARGEEVVWAPPEPEYSSAGTASLSWGICQGASYSGPGGTGTFIYPTGSSRVSGWFFHDWRNPTHIGLDYACRRGDPIYAADNGVVTIAGWNGGYGILIEINHGNGFVTRYAHLDEASGLAAGCGQAIYQGQVLGYCGNTGWSTGPHLHYEIRHQGAPQDPQAYLP